MKRKSFTFKGLKFFERNKEDLDFIGLSEKFRQYNFQFIQNNIKNEDQQLSMMMKEMHEQYTIEQLSVFMYSNPEQVKERIWDSYKVNPDANGELLTKEQLFEKVKGEEQKLLKLILENETDKETKKKVKAEAGN